MKFFLSLLVCLLASVASFAQTTDADKITALQSEVRKLRLELLQQRIEFQQWKIEQLESRLKQIKDERAELEAEERAVQQALSEISTTEADETASYKTELTETTLKKNRAQQAACQQREAELQDKLHREQQTLQELTRRANQPLAISR